MLSLDELFKGRHFDREIIVLCARPTNTRRARGLARALAQHGGQRGRKTFALASMSLLRRPDDHRRNIRRRAFFPLAIAEPDQDRHLMTVAALPATQRLSVSLLATRRNGPPLSSHRPQTLSRRRAHAGPSYARDRTRSSPTFPSIRNGCLRPPQPHPRSVRDLQIPIACAQPNRASSSPRFPPYEAFGPRPRAQSRRACKGPASETLQLSGHFKSRVALSMRGHGPGKVSCALSRAAKRAESRERRRWQRHCRNRSRFFV
jgi:hypothetical protein